MPRYEYACRRCGHQFIEDRPVSERDQPSPCPTCGNPFSRRAVVAAFMTTRRSASTSSSTCAGAGPTGFG